MKLRILLVLIAICCLAFLPWWGSASLLQFSTNALLLATLAQSWNIIGGFTGYASFGNSIFYGLGGYGVAISMLNFHLPFGIGLIAGAILAVLLAFFLGLAVLRLRGHYFAIATLACTFTTTAIISNLDFAGGNIGLVLPIGLSDTLFFELSFTLLILVTIIMSLIAKSRFGLGLVAIRENENAAAVMGINTTRYKILAFMLCGLFASLAGGIHAYWITFLDPESAFDITLNIKMIIMTIFGGAGTVLGPIFGALTLSAISEMFAIYITNLANLFFGFIIVIAIIFMPRGCTDLALNFRKVGWRYFLANIKKTKI